MGIKSYITIAVAVAAIILSSVYAVWHVRSRASLLVEGLYFINKNDEAIFTVKDKDRTPIEGSSVEIANGTKITDKNGQVRFTPEQAGAYSALASKGKSRGETVLRVYPEGNEAIPIRGLRWRTKPFFETPHVMRAMGANYIQFKADYYIDRDFNLVPLVFNCMPPRSGKNFIPVSAEEMRAETKMEIDEARSVGLKIHFFTYMRFDDATLLEKRDYISGEDLSKLLDRLEQEAVEWAKFLEKEKVEMFTPAQYLDKYIDSGATIKWYRKILPELRRHYSGKLVIPQIRQDLENFQTYDYSGYDYLGLDFLPTNVHSWKELDSLVKNMLAKAEIVRKRDGIGLLIMQVGGILEDTEELWGQLRGDPGELKKRVYEIVAENALPEIKDGKIDGIFFYEWEFSIDTHAWSEKENGQDKMVDKYQGTKPAEFIRNLFLKDPYEVYANQYVVREMTPVIVDPQGDSRNWKQEKPTYNPDDDIKAVYTSADNENLYIMVTYYSKPSLLTLVKIDLDFDGTPEIEKRVPCFMCTAVKIFIPLKSLRNQHSIFL